MYPDKIDDIFPAIEFVYKRLEVDNSNMLPWEDVLESMRENWTIYKNNQDTYIPHLEALGSRSRWESVWKPSGVFDILWSQLRGHYSQTLEQVYDFESGEPFTQEQQAAFDAQTILTWEDFVYWVEVQNLEGWKSSVEQIVNQLADDFWCNLDVVVSEDLTVRKHTKYDVSVVHAIVTAHSANLQSATADEVVIFPGVSTSVPDTGVEISFNTYEEAHVYADATAKLKAGCLKLRHKIMADVTQKFTPENVWGFKSQRDENYAKIKKLLTLLDQDKKLIQKEFQRRDGGNYTWERLLTEEVVEEVAEEAAENENEE